MPWKWPTPRLAKGTKPAATYQYYGDEFGMLTFSTKGQRLELGSKVEFVAPHCDPTVNLHDYFHCLRADKLEDIWRIDARGSL